MGGNDCKVFKVVGIMALAASVSLLWGGCVSYTSVPEPSKGIAFGHTNSGAAIKVIAVSIERVVLRHRARDSMGRYAVNLPVGTTPETGEAILSRLPEGAVLPYEGMDGSVPVYHIGRVWLRGAGGKVDVVYPLEGGLDGGVTVWVRGGDRPWYVQRMQYWAPGTVPTPLMYIPVGKNGGEVEVMEPAVDSTGDLDVDSVSQPDVPAGHHQGNERSNETIDEMYREIRG